MPSNPTPGTRPMTELTLLITPDWRSRRDGNTVPIMRMALGLVPRTFPRN